MALNRSIRMPESRKCSIVTIFCQRRNVIVIEGTQGQSPTGIKEVS